jgi:hypothetical protein
MLQVHRVDDRRAEATWRQAFRWKTGRQAEKAKWHGFEVITAHDSRAAGPRSTGVIER